ncbi:MAG: adenylate/guanylate cyclase domain-containing protein [Gemmataceae bacterium]|nr:adenylate/guanylate cyclase domain-containing protein [Gemmataceae bacterium]
MPALKLRILEDDRLSFEVPLTMTVELGRQRTGEPGPYRALSGSAPGTTRVVMAHQQESNCSRQHVLLQPLASSAVRVTNRSKVVLPRVGATAIAPGASMDLVPPFSLRLGSRTLSISDAESVDEFDLHGLDGQTIAPGSLQEFRQPIRPLPSLSPPQLNELIGWLQTTMGVLQSTVGSPDFLSQAADALVRIVGLDSGRVLLLQGGEWTVAAVHETALEGDAQWHPSQRVLTKIQQEKRTFWQRPQQQAPPPESASLIAVHTAVASPLLDGDGNVIGALYGERRRLSMQMAAGDGKLEAMLVEMLACSISTGLARQEQQQAAMTARAQFEQFFTPQLAKQLREEPDLLAGREAVVTLLFCDIRAFSRVSERLGPAGTVRWIGDTMGDLSQCVLEQEGVLVDYVGDELLAMWGAPTPHADHGVRAALAALAMRRALETLNDRWLPTLGEPMDLGIGLNTGPVQVGNTGSRYKFKYGPLGNTVNVASRVQGLTKFLRCRMLVTAATRQCLDDRFIARRVCRARVVNIVEPVDLYDVEAASTPERAQFFLASEAALEALEAREFALAARRSGEILLRHPGDGPLLLILSRVAQQLVQADLPFDPVWEPPGK